MDLDEVNLRVGLDNGQEGVLNSGRDLTLGRVSIRSLKERNG
jgi:hypothetical protein